MTIEKAKSGWSTVKTTWRYIEKYRLSIICVIVLAALCVALALYVPVLAGRAIDQIVGPGAVDFDGIFAILLEIGVIILLTAIVQWFMDITNKKVTFAAMRDVRNAAFHRLQQLPLSYVDSHSHGDILSRMVADVDQFSDGLLMGFTQLFTGVLTIAGTLVFMLIISPGITLVVVVLTPLSLLVANFIARRTYAMFSLQSKLRGEQSAYMEEMIGNQKVVKAFGYEGEAQARFDEINDRLEKASLRATFFSSITNPSTRFVNGLVYAAVALSGALTAIDGGITIGGLLAFLSYANQYTKPFNEISGVIAELQNALACAARIFQLIEEPPQPPEAMSAHTLVETRGSVALDHVSFSYTKERELIRDFNLAVSPGQRIAIVGPTGCGKTTMINLLMRFYDVDEGSITVDGRDIRDITRNSLRRSFGMVLQETWLKEGTIRENIAMGKPEATLDEIIAASHASHAHNFIKRLPEGYDTYIGGDEGNLSQGERQMLCIARVMLCLPPMLILDEATSSIDTRTEILIQEAFAKLMEGRTSFIVAHRLSTIREADVILVMRDGKVVEQGNHKHLIQKNGFYAQLYNSQFVL